MSRRKRLLLEKAEKGAAIATTCKADAASAAGVIARVSHRASALGGSQSSRRETSCGPSGFDEESALYALREEQLAEHTSWLAEQTR